MSLGERDRAERGGLMHRGPRMQLALFQTPHLAVRTPRFDGFYTSLRSRLFEGSGASFISGL
eukprot:1912156-Pyramimonas_sp.AAC.1